MLKYTRFMWSLLHRSRKCNLWFSESLIQPDFSRPSTMYAIICGIQVVAYRPIQLASTCSGRLLIRLFSSTGFDATDDNLPDTSKKLKIPDRIQYHKMLVCRETTSPYEALSLWPCWNTQGQSDRRRFDTKGWRWSCQQYSDAKSLAAGSISVEEYATDQHCMAETKGRHWRLKTSQEFFQLGIRLIGVRC
jgi:hypothetical protein